MIPALLLAAQEMTLGAWVFLLGTWGAIFLLTSFCVAKVLASGKK